MFRWIALAAVAGATGAMLFLGVGLMAASWFILLVTALAVILIRFAVVPPEEEALVARFGDAYREYRARTGRLLPRFGRAAAPGREGARS